MELQGIRWEVGCVWDWLVPGRGEGDGGDGGGCSLKCPPPVEAGSEVEEVQTGITPQSEEMLLNVNNYTITWVLGPV